jgi:hypothetical protein
MATRVFLESQALRSSYTVLKNVCDKVLARHQLMFISLSIGKTSWVG